MGIFGSKTPDSASVTPFSVKKSNPENLKALPIDPRSPSEEIARTPIMVEASPGSADSCSDSNRFSRTPLSILANRNARKEKSLSQRMFGKFKHKSDNKDDRGQFCNQQVSDWQGTLMSNTSIVPDNKENSDIQ